MLAYLDAVLASRLMRGAYATAFLVSFVYLWGTAIRADERPVSKAGPVVCSAVVAVVCAWMAVAPRGERHRIVLRSAGLVVGGVTCGLTVAGLGAFDPPRREFRPPSDVRSVNDTADVLRASGFADVTVTYPLHSPDTILVRYAGGPSLDQPDTVERVADIVWAHEGVRFQTLTIQGSSTSVSLSYQELAGRLGPRPSQLDSITIAELDSITIAELRALGSIGFGIFEGLDEIGLAITHAAEFLCAGLLATFTVAGAAWAGIRRPAELAVR